MSESLKPICLLADSQLLFWNEEEVPFLERVRNWIDNDDPSAAYIGASNGDRPEFYGIFESAMESIGISRRSMIRSQYPREDADALAQADLILLAGGDVEAGWKVFQSKGLDKLIVERYYAGVQLIGVSAGAVQLGLGGLDSGEESKASLIDTFRLVPLVIGAHEENEQWRGLRRALKRSGGLVPAVGIATGGGMVYHPDHCIEAVRHPLHEFCLREGEIVHNLIGPERPDPA